MPRLSLGLDCSTQGLTALVADLDRRETVLAISIDYRGEELAQFGLEADYLLPPREEGEALQPAGLYLAALELVLRRLAAELPDLGLELREIAVINSSGQQHGHVLLAREAIRLFEGLRGDPARRRRELVSYLEPAFAVPFARIWRSSNTRTEAEEVRRAVGGSRKLIGLSGSDAPLRFSAFGIRRTAKEHPHDYQRTVLIHQLSSLLPAVLAGNARIPLDWGNACGTSLMHYAHREWSEELVAATGAGLPGGAHALAEKLPPLASGLTIIGTVAPYFIERYGFSPACEVGIGSGDNPQTKVPAPGTLLSLGTSFVLMVETGGGAIDPRGWANAMYDALDRPFCFGCRTNGALRWDGVRSAHGLAKADYAPAEAALRDTPCGNSGKIFIWQAEAESFPPAPKVGPLRIGYDSPEFAADYAGIVESSLASVYLNSRRFMAPGDKIYVTGGPSRSPEVLRRVAAIWRREAVPLESGGAALGAAASGAAAWRLSREEGFDQEGYCAGFLRRREGVKPRPEDVRAYHGEGGWLGSSRRGRGSCWGEFDTARLIERGALCLAVAQLFAKRIFEVIEGRGDGGSLTGK